MVDRSRKAGSVIAPAEDADILSDIQHFQQLVEADPDMDTPPAGYKLSDASVARLKVNALDALIFFDQIGAEGHGVTHEVFKTATEVFAATTLLLIVDRETRFGKTALPQRPRRSRWIGSLLNRKREIPSEHIGMTDEKVAELKYEAQQAVNIHLSALEDIPRAASFEAYSVGAVQFAAATAALADDREGRMQTIRNQNFNYLKEG